MLPAGVAGSPSYRRTRESLEVMSSCEACPGSHCMPVILRPLELPRLFFTSAQARADQGVASCSAELRCCRRLPCAGPDTCCLAAASLCVRPSAAQAGPAPWAEMQGAQVWGKEVTVTTLLTHAPSGKSAEARASTPAGTPAADVAGWHLEQPSRLAGRQAPRLGASACRQPPQQPT